MFWPKEKLTKGDLFRYYAQVAPYILPAVADRPLVMKRFPNGIAAKPFYQHRVEDVPQGVRVETGQGRRTSGRSSSAATLLTLLYTTQLAAISQDPWFSRVQSPEFADYAALDLDPMPGLPFSRTLEVARWIHDELELLGAAGVPKTSGSEGLHIYLPLPPGTPYEAGLLFCQIIATVVAQKHPKQATVERTVAARGKRVYVDFMQNVLGKTLATAYSARASEFAGVSTPLTWQEVHDGVDREAFTIRTVPARLQTTGDLWAALSKSKGVEPRSGEPLSRQGERPLEGRQETNVLTHSAVVETTTTLKVRYWTGRRPALEDIVHIVSRPFPTCHCRAQHLFAVSSSWFVECRRFAGIWIEVPKENPPTRNDKGVLKRTAPFSLIILFLRLLPERVALIEAHKERMATHTTIRAELREQRRCQVRATGTAISLPGPTFHSSPTSRSTRHAYCIASRITS